MTIDQTHITVGKAGFHHETPFQLDIRPPPFPETLDYGSANLEFCIGEFYRSARPHIVLTTGGEQQDEEQAGRQHAASQHHRHRGGRRHHGGVGAAAGAAPPVEDHQHSLVPRPTASVIRYYLMVSGGGSGGSTVEQIPDGLLFDSRSGEFASFITGSRDSFAEELNASGSDSFTFHVDVVAVSPNYNATNHADWSGNAWKIIREESKDTFNSYRSGTYVACPLFGPGHDSLTHLSQSIVSRSFSWEVLGRKIPISVSLQEKPHNLHYVASAASGGVMFPKFLEFFTTGKPECQGITGRGGGSVANKVEFSLTPGEDFLPFGLRFSKKSGLVYGVAGSGAPGEQIVDPEGHKTVGHLFGISAASASKKPPTAENLATLFLEGYDREFQVTCKNMWGQASTKLRIMVHPIQLPKSLRFEKPDSFTTFVKCPIFFFHTGEVVQTDAPLLEDRNHFFHPSYISHPELKKLIFRMTDASKSVLPPGLQLDPETGAISGFVPLDLDPHYLNRPLGLTIEAMNFTGKKIEVAVEIHIQQTDHKPVGCWGEAGVHKWLVIIQPGVLSRPTQICGTLSSSAQHLFYYMSYCPGDCSHGLHDCFSQRQHCWPVVIPTNILLLNKPPGEVGNTWIASGDEQLFSCV